MFPDFQVPRFSDFQAPRFPDTAGAAAIQALRSKSYPSPNDPRDQIRRKEPLLRPEGMRSTFWESPLLDSVQCWNLYLGFKNLQGFSLLASIFFMGFLFGHFILDLQFPPREGRSVGRQSYLARAHIYIIII